MKRARRLALACGLALALLAGLAHAVNVDYPLLSWFRAGFWVMPISLGAQTSTANKVTRMLAGSATIDFGSVSITCDDSASITVPGAAVTDPCFVGPPVALWNDGGTGVGQHSDFTCFVYATNAVRVRHCAAGTADDPASATFEVRIISND